MSNIDIAEALNQVKQSLYPSGSYTVVQAVGNIMGRLCSTIGTASTNGTELVNSGGSTYTSQSVTAALPAAGSATTLPITNSVGAITWANLPAVGGSGIQSLELWDSAGTPKRKWFGALAVAKVVALGDSVSIATGQLSITTA